MTKYFSVYTFWYTIAKNYIVSFFIRNIASISMTILKGLLLQMLLLLMLLMLKLLLLVLLSWIVGLRETDDIEAVVVNDD